MDYNDALTASMLSRVARALTICERNGDTDYQAAAEAADRIPDPVLRADVLGRLAEIEARVEALVALAPAVATGHGVSARAAVPRFARELVAALPAVAEVAPPVPAPAPAPKPKRARRG